MSKLRLGDRVSCSAYIRPSGNHFEIDNEDTGTALLWRKDATEGEEIEDYESCEKFVTKTALFTGVFVGVTWLCTELFCEWNDPPYTDAMKLGMLTFYFATSGVYAEPVIEDRLAKQICRIVWETHLTLHEREELFLDTIRDDTLPEHIMSAKDCAYIFDVCAAGRVEDAREMLGRFVTAHVAK